MARQTKAFDQWSRNWVNFVESHVGAWMHVDHGLGLYLFANANRRAPTNMHNNAISVNSMHRVRSAQDLALYNLTLSEEIDGFDGTAHLTAWNEDPAWQGVREVAEQLTGIDDWCEAIFAANIVFEPLVGELFRSRLVMQAAPRNGDFCTPTVIGAEEYDFAERDLRYTIPMFHLLTNDREFADHNKGLLGDWLSTWTARAIAAARTLQPLWSQPDAKPPRFEDSLDAAKNRFAGIVTDLNLDVPKELAYDMGFHAGALGSKYAHDEPYVRRRELATVSRIRRVFDTQSNAELATLLGTTPPTITSWEHGASPEPENALTLKYTAALAGLVDEFIEPEDVSRYLYDTKIPGLGDRSIVAAVKDGDAQKAYNLLASALSR